MPELRRGTPERPLYPQPEIQADTIETASPERPRPVQELSAAEAVAPVLPIITPTPAATQIQISPLQRQVEDILSEGLADLYRALDPAQQAEFKTKGEVVSAQISTLLQQAKVKVSEILKLIKDWLLGLPGINKFYAEQAAKIKADKLLKLH